MITTHEHTPSDDTEPDCPEIDEFETTAIELPERAVPPSRKPRQPETKEKPE